MSVPAALGFTLFGVVFGIPAGMLLLARWWTRALYSDPTRLQEFLTGLGKSLREDPKVRPCPEHGCPICGKDRRCPICERRTGDVGSSTS